MNSPLARTLLAAAALVLISSALLHASAYAQVSSGVAASGLSPVLGNAYRALWLADSTTVAAVGIVSGMLAFRPALATPAIVLVLALIPAAAASFIYHFLGAFPPGHLMIAATGLMVVAAAAPRGKPA
jgi:hypothetical protein